MEDAAPENKAFGWNRFSRAERRRMQKSGVVYTNCFTCGAKLLGEPGGRQWCSVKGCQFKLINGKRLVKKGKR